MPSSRVRRLTLVASSVRSTVSVVKVPRGQVTRVLLVVGHGAPVIRMHRDLVDLEVVDTLEDVDLSTDRPVGTVLPPSGPGGTTDGHVNGVHQDETSGEHELAVQSDGFTVAADPLGGVHLHDGVTLVVDRDEAFVPLRTIRR